MGTSIPVATWPVPERRAGLFPSRSCPCVVRPRAGWPAMPPSCRAVANLAGPGSGSRSRPHPRPGHRPHHGADLRGPGAQTGCLASATTGNLAAENGAASTRRIVGLGCRRSPLVSPPRCGAIRLDPPRPGPGTTAGSARWRVGRSAARRRAHYGQAIATAGWLQPPICSGLGLMATWASTKPPLPGLVSRRCLELSAAPVSRQRDFRRRFQWPGPALAITLGLAEILQAQRIRLGGQRWRQGQDPAPYRFQTRPIKPCRPVWLQGHPGAELLGGCGGAWAPEALGFQTGSNRTIRAQDLLQQLRIRRQGWRWTRAARSSRSSGHPRDRGRPGQRRGWGPGALFPRWQDWRRSQRVQKATGQPGPSGRPGSASGPWLSAKRTSAPALNRAHTSATRAPGKLSSSASSAKIALSIRTTACCSKR